MHSIYPDDVPEIIELYLVLNMFANKEVEKLRLLKRKQEKRAIIKRWTTHYPVLMAADILIHRADFVPVGKDQEQHLEMTEPLVTGLIMYKTDLFPEPQLCLQRKSGENICIGWQRSKNEQI